MSSLDRLLYHLQTPTAILLQTTQDKEEFKNQCISVFLTLYVVQSDAVGNMFKKASHI